MNTGEQHRLHEDLVAYLEGALGPEEKERVEREIASNAVYRRELEWMQQAYRDLDAMGREAVASLPEIDIVDDVLAGIENLPAPSQPVPLKPRERKSSGALNWYGPLAAAVIIVLGIGYVFFRPGSGTPTAPYGGAGPSPVESSRAPTGVPAPLAESLIKLDQGREELLRTANVRPVASELEATKSPDIDLNAGIEPIVAARREVASGGTGMDKLRQWATLKKDRALELALAPDATPTIMLAAAETIKGAEAQRLLLTAVGKMPEDPHARLALAESYAEDPAPEKRAEAAHVAEQLRGLDPNNALPYYVEARARLEQGDIEAALQLLAAAESLGQASAYALKAAQTKAEFLIAGGMSEEAANALAAFTGGTEQYEFLCDLGRDLIEYGREFLAANDLATAERIFQAVERLGQQVEAGAAFSQEQMAGLELQAQAIDVLEQLFTLSGDAEDISDLTATTQSVTQRISELSGFFELFNSILLSQESVEFWNMLAGLILQNGDMAVPESLAQSAR